MRTKIATIISLLTLGSIALAAPAPTTELVQKRDGPNYYITSVAVKNRSTFTPDNFTGLYMDTVDNHAVLKNSTLTPNATVSPSTTRPWYLDSTDGTIELANSEAVLKISNEAGVINVDGNSNAWSHGFSNDNGILKNNGNWVSWYGCPQYSSKFDQVVYFLHDTFGASTIAMQGCYVINLALTVVE